MHHFPWKLRSLGEGPNLLSGPPLPTWATLPLPGPLDPVALGEGKKGLRQVRYLWVPVPLKRFRLLEPLEPQAAMGAGAGLQPAKGKESHFLLSAPHTSYSVWCLHVSLLGIRGHSFTLLLTSGVTLGQFSNFSERFYKWG